MNSLETLLSLQDLSITSSILPNVTVNTIDELKERIDHLQKQNNTLSVKLSQLHAQNHALGLRCCKLETLCLTQETQIKENHLEIDRLNARINSVIATIDNSWYGKIQTYYVRFKIWFGHRPVNFF